MLQYDIHPLSVRISEDLEFFNHPSPDIHCLHCGFPCDLQPPIPIPTRHQDAKLGSANPRDSNQMKHETTHAHKLYCSPECAKACVKDIPMFGRMLQKVYGIMDILSIRTALPTWTLQSFGGCLDRSLYEQYKKQGKIDGYCDQLLDCSSLIEEYRKVCMLLLPYNPYFNINVFSNGLDNWWYQALPQDTPLVCWNDIHSLSNIKPCTMVLEYNEGNKSASNLNKKHIPYQCRGLFCSLACIFSYIVRYEGQLKMQKIGWNQEFYSLQFEHGLPVVSKRSPHRRTLKIFGGILSIDQFRHATTPYSIIREPPIRTFGNLFAIKEDHQEDGIDESLYTIVYKTHEFHVLSLLHQDTSARYLKMNGDEYNQQTRHFPKLFHTIKNNIQHKLHFTLMVLEREEAMRSNQEILQCITQS